MTAPTWKDRRSAAERQRKKRSDDRARRWLANRYAVPYSLDGPKVLLGVAWLVAVLGLAVLDPRLVGLVVIPVVAVAALQSTHAWVKTEPCDERVAALVALILAASAYTGAAVTGLVTLGSVIIWFADSILSGHKDSESLVRFTDIGIRTSIPAGLAGASMILLANNYIEAFVALVLLVSAYEAGDFLVGTGADNAFEGPIAGMLAVGVLGAGLALVQPAPFDAFTMALYAGLIAVCSPLGQLAASAILPHGTSWAPALRRIDSYLIGAILWWLALPT